MRELFEEWYLKVLKGNPLNLMKVESGEYLYAGPMYLGREAATRIEREVCATLCEPLQKSAEAAGVEALMDYAGAIRARGNTGSAIKVYRKK